MAELQLYPTFKGREYLRPMWISHPEAAVKVVSLITNILYTTPAQPDPNVIHLHHETLPTQVSDIKKIARKIADLDIDLKYISYGIEPEMQALIKLSHLPIGIAIFPSLAVDGC